MDATFVDFKNLAQQAIKADKAVMYRKFATVRFVRAKGGEIVITTLANGLEETRNIATEGDVIVTNPGGEKYIVDGATFDKKYSDNGDGTATARGRVLAFQNPMEAPIEGVAPWGETQRGDANCVLAISVDANGKPSLGDTYIIGATEFGDTYVKEQ